MKTKKILSFILSLVIIVTTLPLYEIPITALDHGEMPECPWELHDTVCYVETVEPTCTSVGYDVYLCDTCQRSFNENYVTESDHNYANNCDETWTISDVDAKRIAITFSEDTYTESNYDQIYIYDANDNQIGVYSGNELAGQRIVVSSNTVKIRLVSDDSVTYYGFAVTNIEYYYEECTHTNTEIRNAVGATCQSYGYTGEIYCSDCGILLKASEKLSLGTHSMVDGTCEVCGVAEDCSGFQYEVISEEDKTIRITGCSTEGANLTIPSEIDGYRVIEIGDSAFENCIGIETVVIPDGVITIGEGAFYNCLLLKSIVIPDTVTVIGEATFAYCSNLADIVVPDSVTSIAYGAFHETAYYNDESNWENGVLYFGSILYSANPDVVSGDFTIKDGTTSIAPGAFIGCSNLTNVNVPTSVTSIGEMAFVYCSSLTNINIPAGVTTLSGDMFTYCTKLQNIYVDEQNEHYASVSGVLFNADKTTLIKYPEGKTLESYQVPDSVTTIATYSMCNISSLKEIALPDNLQSIEDYAFTRSALLEVTIPDSVSSVGNGIFMDCTALTSVELSDAMTIISNYMFSGCISLQYFYVPSNVTNIANTALNGCTSISEITVDAKNTVYTSVDGVLFNADKTILIKYPEAKTNEIYDIPNGVVTIQNISACYLKELIIPNSVTNLNCSFSGCDSLEKITVGTGVTSLESYNFDYIPNLKTVIIADGRTKIDSYAFENCMNLESITIPDSVKTVGEYAFRDCTSLKSFVIPNSVTSFSYYALQGCTALEEITIGSGIENIKSLYLDDFTNLKKVTISEGRKSITRYDFDNCTNIETIVLPDDITSIEYTAFNDTAYYNTDSNWVKGVLYIGDYLISAKSDVVSGNYKIKGGTILAAQGAFINCTNLTSVRMPTTMTEISFGMFKGCTNLSSVTIADSITKIDEQAFYGCTSLTEISLPNSVTEIGGSAFRNCSGLTAIKLPNAIETIYGYTFAGCTGLTKILIHDNIKNLDDYAFQNCTNLTQVIIGRNITSIDDCVFNGCSNLEKLYGFIGTASETFASARGFEFVAMADMDFDDILTSEDYDEIIKIVTLTKAETDEQKIVGDLNYDGVIDGFDVICLDLMLYETVGTYENPEVIESSGSYTATTESGNGYYYVYTAIEACTATVTMDNTTSWHYSIEVEPASENDEERISYWHWFDDDPVVSSETIEIAAGDTIILYVRLYDPEVWNASGEVNWTLSITSNDELPQIPSTD